MSAIKSILIRGDFTDAEFAELVAVIRRLDDRRPDARFELVAVDPTRPSDVVEQVLRESLPPQPGRTTTVVKHRRAKPH